jgi:hypothetical protein
MAAEVMILGAKKKAAASFYRKLRGGNKRLLLGLRFRADEYYLASFRHTRKLLL